MQKTLTFVLDDLLRELKKLEPINIQSACDEIDVISTFINKNIEIINHATELQSSELKMQAKITSSYSEELTRLMAFQKEGPEVYKQEIEKSYDAGRVNAREVLHLMTL